MVMQLSVGDLELTLQSDATGWCEVDLRHNGKSVQLGAEQLGIVTERLASALREDLEGEAIGTIDGLSVVWVLSLAEEHASIYAAQSNEERILFFQDASGSLMGSAVLNNYDRKRWLAQLRSKS